MAGTADRAVTAAVTLRRGELRRVDLGGGVTAAVVVQSDAVSAVLPTAVVVPVVAAAPRAGFPAAVELLVADRRWWALPTRLTVTTAAALKQPVGPVDAGRMARLDAALRLVLELP
jgi:mRNA-degrading endonuclease toxin of MazEF toxin-antitoxin module